MIITTTRCGKKWPLHYVTYHQETKAPYRRADRAHVIRLFRLGIVFGRVTRRIADPDEALRLALGSWDVGRYRPVEWDREAQQFTDRFFKAAAEQEADA
jgi:hypothetical protein